MSAWIESLQKAIDYIEDHLLEELTIDKISKEANSSPFHFQRTFSILTDVTVGEYIRRRRLTLAAQEITNGDLKIIDVAYKYGYDTPEAFTKAFRRQHGVTPTEARNRIGKLNSYNRLVIQVSLKGVEPMKYRMVQREAFQVVGVKREYSYETGENLREIPGFWMEANQSGLTNQLAAQNNGDIKGVLGVCVDKGTTKAGYMDYWIAVEHTGKSADHLERITIPASNWAVFEVLGAMPNAMQNAWKQIASEWFPSSGYQPVGTPEFELYTDDDPYSPDCYSEIWIPVMNKQ